MFGSALAHVKGMSELMSLPRFRQCMRTTYFCNFSSLADDAASMSDKCAFTSKMEVVQQMLGRFPRKGFGGGVALKNLPTPSATPWPAKDIYKKSEEYIT